MVMNVHCIDSKSSTQGRIDDHSTFSSLFQVSTDVFKVNLSVDGDGLSVVRIVRLQQYLRIEIV